jgi:hypothetical protein
MRFASTRFRSSDKERECGHFFIYTTPRLQRLPPSPTGNAASTTSSMTILLVTEWLPYLAQCFGAPAPRHIPNFLAKIAVGEHAVAMMNDIRGVSNAKARQQLHWEPKWSS